MTEDEVAAVHEAAHAVFAILEDHIKLAGPVALRGTGCGDVVMSTDGGSIARAIQVNPHFDRSLPRIALVRSLLAGPIAERILAESGRAALDEADLRGFAENDYATIADQLAALDPPQPERLDQLEREVRARLDDPATWSAVERFAAILIERRRLEATEATAILVDLLEPAAVRATPASERWSVATRMFEALRGTFRRGGG